MWVKKNGIVPTGCSTVTRGKIGQLECKYIIHTVGPIWYEHSKAENHKLLASCVVNTLEIGKYLGIE
jgi:O-acetyl-ADP-ribose deacetylase (regulator of RNase III)